jgi:lactoylglutathione lyase
VTTGPPDDSKMSLRIELFPADLDEVVTFYTYVLLFRIVKDERDAEWPYVALRRGTVQLGVAQRDDSVDLQSRRPPCGTEIVLEVGDVVAERDRVRLSWHIFEDLTARPWGLTDFCILDPAGYYLRITDT